jgi:hypothetical protein
VVGDSLVIKVYDTQSRLFDVRTWPVIHFRFSLVLFVRFSFLSLFRFPSESGELLFSFACVRACVRPSVRSPCFLVIATKSSNGFWPNFMWSMSITYRIHSHTQIFELTDNWSARVTGVISPHYVCTWQPNPWADFNHISCDICSLPTENHMFRSSIQLTTGPLVSRTFFAVVFIAAKLLNRFRPNFIWCLSIPYRIQICLNFLVHWQLVRQSCGVICLAFLHIEAEPLDRFQPNFIWCMFITHRNPPYA